MKNSLLSIFAAFSGAFVASSASANLWETQAQIEQRYGPPVKIKGYPDRRSYIYAFENWRIKIEYFDGVSEVESYRHLDGEAHFTDTEVRNFLASNSAGNWSTVWQNEWFIDTSKGRAHAMLHQGFDLDVYTESSLKRDSAELSKPRRTHEETTFTGVLTLKPDGETPNLVFLAKDLLIQLSWQYLANRKNPQLAPGKTYTLALRDEDPIDEEDVIAFVTDCDHKSFTELTEDSKSYLVMRIQDGDDVVFDRSICEVHHIKMAEVTVEVNYGMWGPSAAEANCAKNFPHYRNFVRGGCNVDDTRKTALRYVCPKCVEGCERSKL